MTNEHSPLVSVCVVTYNQEMYIAQTIESILSQEFEGRLEIIIGEDCSPDNTAKIVEEYQRQHPNVVKIVTSQNNVGAQANFTRVLKAAQGDFIAICDGDDYWIDTGKIQKQLDAFEDSNSELCFTPANKVLGSEALGVLASYGKEQRVFSFSDIINGGGGMIPSPALMVRRQVVERLPDWFKGAPVGDYFLQILGAEKGAIYLPEVTAAYRVQAVNSWSSNREKFPVEKLMNEADNYQLCFSELKKSYPEKSASFNKRLAAELAFLAFTLFKKKEFTSANLLYSRSSKINFVVNKTQVFMFFASKFSHVFWWLLALKNRLR
ncbi:glycosyltransferase family 2 protein [Pseudoalteromonas sp. T1lg88]|uniref:glycosyltransferase family 2 protein n=1 Tax=Pseudoalteromonas sp. T1lg88 TaxID=2077104 RepID=UPI000CF702EC|nr:glycosyltransferase [Pseudoalteromonas sp. T1lg88]